MFLFFLLYIAKGLGDLIYKGKVFFYILISRVCRMELKQVTVISSM